MNLRGNCHSLSQRQQSLICVLRSPVLIVAEIAVITLAGVAGTLLPEDSHVFRSGWFLGAVALAFASLLVVVGDQCQRLVRVRPRAVAPYGGLIIHIGLLVVIVAAALKALFGVEAMVDVMEGETLPPTASAWAVQKPGALVGPLRVAESVTLEAVEARRYKAGDLQNLAVHLHLAGPQGGAPRQAEVPVNKSITASGIRLFVGSDYGPAALMEWRGATGGMARTAALLKHERGRRFEGTLKGPDGEHAYLRAEVGAEGNRPAGVEVRVMKGSALLLAGVMRVGETLALPSGGVLSLHGAPFWVRLHASRDPVLWLIYFGFALLFAGVTMRFMFVSIARPAVLMTLACVLGLTACNGVSRTQARQLVERYNTVVSEAYRRGDVKLVDSVVGPNEGRKLTGLIGVRLDLGLTLDAKMLSLEVLEAVQSKDDLHVLTRERWSYCDRRIGTGEQVGETSEDAYEMRYFFKRMQGEWLVDRIEFAAPPRFGRTPATWAVARGQMPGHAGSRTENNKEAVTP